MNQQDNNTAAPVYVLDGLRTPQLKSSGKPGPFSASDLAVVAGRQLLLSMPFSAQDLDEVIMGCVMPEASEANIARQIALRIGCDIKISAWTVQRNCASGMQAIDSGMNSIRSGKAKLVMVGGTEAMSRAPVMWTDDMVNWLAQVFKIRAHGLSAMRQYFLQVLRFRPGFLRPVFSLIKGLNDPMAGLSMGQTAENIASRFHIRRSEMDHYALRSHQRLATSIKQGKLDNEITPLYDHEGHYFAKDNGVREDSSFIKLSRLRAVFDKKYGAITAGNSAQVSDGATVLILASEDAIRKYDLTPLGKLIDCHWQGLSPAEMGLGPAHTIPPLLQKHQLNLKDIDYWEINEAFAAQVLACQKALNNDDFCHNTLGLPHRLGAIPDERLNIDGGGISLGHPVGASGSRIVLHLLKLLQRQQQNSDVILRGIASLCIGGGQGGAMLIESMR